MRTNQIEVLFARGAEFDTTTMRNAVTESAQQNAEMEVASVGPVKLIEYEEACVDNTPPPEFTLNRLTKGIRESFHAKETRNTSDHFTALIVYVDDILLTGSSLSVIEDVKAFLDQRFTIKNLGDAKYFLGVELARDSTGLTISQTKYATDVLKDAGVMNMHSAPSPLSHGIILTDPGTPLSDPSMYRKLVGRLLYLNFTRPDLTFASQQLSQYMQTPCQHHLQAAIHVLRYLKGTLHTGLFYSADSSFTLQGYSDADWGTCKRTRRSITGYCIFLGTSLISWKAKKQATVSKSSAESEYRSMSATSCELKWISYLLTDLAVSIPYPIQLFCDNTSAILLAKDPVDHDRTKHLDIDVHVVREHVENGFLVAIHVDSEMQLADLFTKPLSSAQMFPALVKMGLITLPALPT